MSARMIVRVNGEPAEVEAGATVVDVLALRGMTGASRGVAVAANGEVVPRAEWGTHTFTAGDVVEVLVAVQGG